MARPVISIRRRDAFTERRGPMTGPFTTPFQRPGLPPFPGIVSPAEVEPLNPVARFRQAQPPGFPEPASHPEGAGVALGRNYRSREGIRWDSPPTSQIVEPRCFPLTKQSQILLGTTSSRKIEMSSSFPVSPTRGLLAWFDDVHGTGQVCRGRVLPCGQHAVRK